MRRVINIRPRATASDAHGSGRRIHVYVLDAGKIDHQSIVNNSQASGIVAAASDGHAQALLPTEIECGNDIGHVSTLGDQARFAADHGVVYFACFVVSRVGGFNQLATELISEFIDGFLLHGFLLIRGNITGSNITLQSQAFRKRSLGKSLPFDRVLHLVLGQLMQPRGAPKLKQAGTCPSGKLNRAVVAELSPGSISAM
jgi:hypothetical protein